MGNAGSAGANYQDRLQASFAAFPDTHDAMRQQGLAFYRYVLQNADADVAPDAMAEADIEELIAGGMVRAEPIVYEDFLPVSAAGIFQSNLGGGEQRAYDAHANQEAFEAALGKAIHDPFALYAQAQDASIAALRG